MRNAMKSVLAAAVASVALVGGAHALDVPGDIRLGTFGDAPGVPYQGDIVLKYVNYDVGRLYGSIGAGGFTPPATGNYARAVPANAGESNALAIAQMNAVSDVTPASYKVGAFSPGGAEDGWGILRVDTIYDASQSRILWSRTLAPYEITGMFWGEQDTYLSVPSAGNEVIHGVGFQSAFYADASKNFNFDQGGLGPAARTGLTTYPTVTDGTLIWTMKGLAGSADTTFPQDEFLTDFNPAAGPGSPNVGNGKVDGDFVANDAGLGVNNNMFQVKAGADWSVKFSGISPQNQAASWLVQSNDPLVATTVSVPNPSAVTGGLLLGAMLGLGRLRRRQQA